MDDRDHKYRTFHGKPWNNTLSFLRGEIIKSRERLDLVRNPICCKKRNLLKELWPPFFFKVSILQEWHRELLMLQQIITNTGLTSEKRV